MGNQRFWQRLHVGMVSKCLHIFQAGNSAQQLPSLCHRVSPNIEDVLTRALYCLVTSWKLLKIQALIYAHVCALQGLWASCQRWA